MTRAAGFTPDRDPSATHSGNRYKMPFARRKAEIETPFGRARRVGDNLSVPWRRWRGVMIDLQWRADTEPDEALVQLIGGDLDRLVGAAMERLGIEEFPDELRTIVPEAVSLHPQEPGGNWSLSFRCVEWEDGIWGVVFRDEELLRDYEGD